MLNWSRSNLIKNFRYEYYAKVPSRISVRQAACTRYNPRGDGLIIRYGINSLQHLGLVIAGQEYSYQKTEISILHPPCVWPVKYSKTKNFLILSQILVNSESFNLTVKYKRLMILIMIIICLAKSHVFPFFALLSESGTRNGKYCKFTGLVITILLFIYLFDCNFT